MILHVRKGGSKSNVDSGENKKNMLRKPAVSNAIKDESPSVFLLMARVEPSVLDSEDMFISISSLLHKQSRHPVT